MKSGHITPTVDNTVIEAPHLFTGRRKSMVMDATIPSGATTSGTISITTMKPLAIITPASINASSLKIQVSYDGDTWQTWYDAGADVSITVVASKYVTIPALARDGIVAFIRLVANTATNADHAYKVVVAND